LAFALVPTQAGTPASSTHRYIERIAAARLTRARINVSDASWCGQSAAMTTTPQLTDHAQRNRDQWQQWSAEYVDAAQRAWASPAPYWGIWSIPEHEVRAFGDDALAPYAGRDIVELGCGTAYWSAWFARAGARPIGVDLTPGQLATARTLQGEHGVDFPLIEASAEQVPLADACADLVFSEYGASIWCDPYLWLPEAARLLRPGGELVFLVNSVLSMLCMGEDGLKVREQLARPLLGMHRFEWLEDDQDDSVEFHLPHGVLIDLLGSLGLRLRRLVELYAPAGSPDSTPYTYMTREWAERWPCEEIWVCQKDG
jgi:SAM-dependent methyltransferase